MLINFGTSLSLSLSKGSSFLPFGWKTIIKCKKEYALSVVMVNKGYPGKYKKNNIIKNLNLIKEDMNTKIFHSGTSLDTKNNIIATGGRVLSVTSKNKNFNIAKKKFMKL